MILGRYYTETHRKRDSKREAQNNTYRERVDQRALVCALIAPREAVPKVADRSLSVCIGSGLFKTEREGI